MALRASEYLLSRRPSTPKLKEFPGASPVAHQSVEYPLLYPSPGAAVYVYPLMYEETSEKDEARGPTLRPPIMKSS